MTMQAVYRGQHIEPWGSDITATDADCRAAGQQCTTFLDYCAAESTRGRWFPTSCNRGNSHRIRILAAVRELGQATANDAAIRARLHRGQAEKVLHRMVMAGEVRIVGKRNHARVYEAMEDR